MNGMPTSAPAGADIFPAPNFPIQEVSAAFKFRFALKNPEEHQAAKRAVDAAKKLLADAGAEIEVEFS